MCQWILLCTAALSLCSCCPRIGLTVHGAEQPCAEEVYQAAEALGCELDGKIYYQDEVVEHGGLRYYGYCWWDACEFHVKVMRRGDTAMDSSLAHELGHWCEHTANEDAASRFGGRVNEIARATCVP